MQLRHVAFLEALPTSPPVETTITIVSRPCLPCRHRLIRALAHAPTVQLRHVDTPFLEALAQQCADRIKDFSAQTLANR